MSVYDISTDADPETINAVMLEVFRQWVLFALGRHAIGGKMLMHPTGKYASSITMKSNPGHVAVMADESIAPEALFIELGHGRIDLKEKLRPGVYPMHRGAAGQPFRTPQLYAKRRASGFSGFASIGPNSPADSWIIPPMPAMQPGWHLAKMAADALRGGGSKGSLTLAGMGLLAGPGA